MDVKVETADVVPGDVDQDWRNLWGPTLHAKQLRDAMGLFDEDDMVKLLGLTKQTLQSWRADKIGPDYVKLGKSVFYRKNDVSEWIARCVVVTKRVPPK